MAKATRPALTKTVDGPEFAPPTIIRRILDAARTGAADYRLGSELGRLRLTSQISDQQMAAGLRYAEIVDRYRLLFGLPDPQRQAAYPEAHITDRVDDEIIAGLRLYDGDLQEFAKTHEKAKTVLLAKKRYAGAVEALLKIGPIARRSVDMVCVEDRCIPVGERQWLVAGLNALGTL